MSMEAEGSSAGVREDSSRLQMRSSTLGAEPRPPSRRAVEVVTTQICGHATLAGRKKAPCSERRAGTLA